MLENEKKKTMWVSICNSKKELRDGEAVLNSSKTIPYTETVEEKWMFAGKKFRTFEHVREANNPDHPLGEIRFKKRGPFLIYQKIRVQPESIVADGFLVGSIAPSRELVGVGVK